MDFQLCFQYYFYNPASVMIRSGPFLCSHPRIHLLLFAFDECIGNIWLRVFFFLSFILPSAFILFLYDEQIIQHRKNLKYSDKWKLNIKTTKVLLIFCCIVTFLSRYVWGYASHCFVIFFLTYLSWIYTHGSNYKSELLLLLNMPLILEFLSWVHGQLSGL